MESKRIAIDLHSVMARIRVLFVEKVFVFICEENKQKIEVRGK